MTKKENISYVRIDNANMVKLSLKQLAGLYADYAHSILEIKKIADKKKGVKKEIFSKLKDLETRYNALMKELPKLPEPTKIEKPDYISEKGKSIEYEGMADPFGELKEEFESIRSELEKIR